MPYIDPHTRAALCCTMRPENAGELNYTITRIIDQYLGESLSYSTLNEVVGVLECAKLELYRRLAAPYEDRKLALNGDAYTFRP